MSKIFNKSKLKGGNKDIPAAPKQDETTVKTTDKKTGPPAKHPKTWKKTLIELDPELKAKIKKSIANDESKTLSIFINEAIQAHLKK